MTHRDGPTPLRLALAAALLVPVAGCGTPAPPPIDTSTNAAVKPAIDKANGPEITAPVKKRSRR